MKILIVLALILILFFYVWKESQALKMVVKIDALRKESKRLIDEHKRLVALVEINSMLPVIEAKALAMGLRHTTQADTISRILK